MQSGESRRLNLAAVAVTVRRIAARCAGVGAMSLRRAALLMQRVNFGLRSFIERSSRTIDLLIVVTDCRTPWPDDPPPFPVVTIRLGDGTPPPWGDRGANKVITVRE